MILGILENIVKVCGNADTDSLDGLQTILDFSDSFLRKEFTHIKLLNMFYDLSPSRTIQKNLEQS